MCVAEIMMPDVTTVLYDGRFQSLISALWLLTIGFMVLPTSSTGFILLYLMDL